MDADTKGDWSVIFGLFGLYLPVIFAPLAIVLGLQARKSGERKGSFGIALGISGIIIMLLFPLINSWILFPALRSVLKTATPLALIASDSMSHNSSFDSWWSSQEEYYSQLEITKEQFSGFNYKNGIDAGDILVFSGTSIDALKIGDIIFLDIDGERFTHRVVQVSRGSAEYVTTKGDGNHASFDVELRIYGEDIKGKVIGRLPKAGLLKLWFHRRFNAG
ncbi:MAG: hypothetical protein HGA85_08720 [Nanoarchaeota archaeon]|nr:hypothetical protein [Nanoarchaeota archaeon]